HKETRKETSEEEDGQKSADEKKDVVAALDKDVSGATAEESGNLEDAMFDDGVGEGDRIEEEDENGEWLVEPVRGLVAKQVNGDAFENDRNDTDRGSPEHDAGFAARVDRGFLAHRIQEKRSDGEQEERIDNCQTNIIGGAEPEQFEERVWPPVIPSREAR